MKTSYYGKTFIQFFQEFFHTVGLLLQGRRGFSDLAGDEIQVFVLALIGVSCALIGTFLVLRKMTMLANAISHTVLIGIVLAFVFFQFFAAGAVDKVLHIDLKILLVASIFSSLLTLFLTQFLTRYLRLQKDASIGLVFSFLFAIGIVLVTIFTRNTHVGIELIMGNVDLVHKEDLILAFFLALSNICLITLFYKEYVLTAFDPENASLIGISNPFFTALLLMQTSATIIGAFRAVGVVLVLAFIILPVVTARLYTSKLKRLLLLSCLLSLLATTIGVALSRHILTVYGFALSTGGLIVMCQLSLWILSVIFAPKRGVLLNLVHKRRLLAKTTT